MSKKGEQCSQKRPRKEPEDTKKRLQGLPKVAQKEQKNALQEASLREDECSIKRTQNSQKRLQDLQNETASTQRKSKFLRKETVYSIKNPKSSLGQQKTPPQYEEKILLFPYTGDSVILSPKKLYRSLPYIDIEVILNFLLGQH